MTSAPSRALPTVFVVDGDAAVGESLRSLIGRAGWRPEICGSAGELLARPVGPVPSCVVLELDLPDADGLELQRRVRRDHPDLPVLFLAARRDVAAAVQAMKGGALDLLTKPLQPALLIAVIEQALDRSAAALREKALMRALAGRHGSLSAREREVMELVVAGRLNKQIAAELGISEITVKAHRGKVMRKMRAASLPDLVRMGGRLSSLQAGAGAVHHEAVFDDPIDRVVVGCMNRPASPGLRIH